MTSDSLIVAHSGLNEQLEASAQHHVFRNLKKKKHLLLTHAVLNPNHSILLISAQRALSVSRESATNRVGKNLVQERRIWGLKLHTLGYYNEHEKYNMQELLKHLRYAANICCMFNR